MKHLRSGLKLKKSIIKLLKKEGELSLRRLDIKLNTSSQTILNHCRELKYLGVTEIVKNKKNKINGRPYTSIKLTDYGKSLT